MKPTFEMKQEKGCMVSDFQFAKGDLLIVLGHYVRFCTENMLPCVISNVSMKFPQSKSDTHPDGRAFDASVARWPETAIKRCIEYMNHSVGHLGALSLSDNTRRVCVYHDVGLGAHFHMQVAR